MGRAERAVRFAPRFIGPRLALNGPASKAVKAREMRERRSGVRSIVDDESIDEGIATGSTRGTRRTRNGRQNESFGSRAFVARGALERRP